MLADNMWRDLDRETSGMGRPDGAARSVEFWARVRSFLVIGRQHLDPPHRMPGSCTRNARCCNVVQRALDGEFVRNIRSSERNTMTRFRHTKRLASLLAGLASVVLAGSTHAQGTPTVL